MFGSITGWKWSAGLPPRSREGSCRSSFKGCASGRQKRRGGRVVERGGLENRYTFTGIGGSNPPLSATGNVPVRWLAKPSTALLLAPRVAARFIGQADPGRDGRVA